MCKVLGTVCRKNIMISVIIPTLNAAGCLSELLPALKAQTMPPAEIIVVDSGSSDGTAGIAERAGCVTVSIPPSQFNHGATRNLGASLARGEILVFFTQDALPVDASTLERLAHPILERVCAASYARQVARPDAPLPEVFLRLHNYPPSSELRSARSIATKGVRAFLFSNAASAVERATFEKCGGFATDLATNEDMMFCSSLLLAGHRVQYASDALVWHSHRYSLAEHFQRYFDIGSFMSCHRARLGAIAGSKDGWSFVSRLLAFVASRQPRALPRACLEIASRFAGYELGKRAGLLPRALKRICSRNPQYWATA
jgi:rhamnosyltransferase